MKRIRSVPKKHTGVPVWWHTGDLPSDHTAIHERRPRGVLTTCGYTIRERHENTAPPDFKVCQRCWDGIDPRRAAGAETGDDTTSSQPQANLAGPPPNEPAGGDSPKDGGRTKSADAPTRAAPKSSIACLTHAAARHLPPHVSDAPDGVVIPAAEPLDKTLIDMIAANEKAARELPPGLYPGLHADRYHAMKSYASNTALGWLKRSPAHLRAYLMEPPTFIDPTSIGRALHCYLFDGPEAFYRSYQPGPCDHKGKKEWHEWERDLPPGVIGMWPTHFAAVMAMREIMLDHPAARLVLENATQHELSIVWDDPETGVRCKGRPDAIAPDLGAIIDIKSAEDASPRAFSRAIYNYDYHRQGAMYQRGVGVWLPEVEWRTHVIIAQEKKPPYAVAVYEVEGDAMVAGNDEIDNLLRRWKVCVEKDEWPGYDQRFVKITLPPWAWSQLEKEWKESA